MGPNATIRTVLFVSGGVLLFFAVLARIESHEEHQFIRMMDVLIGLMLAVSLGWGRETKPARRKMTIVRVISIWLGVSGSLLALHEFQMYARTTLAFRAHAGHWMSETYEALNNFRRDCGEFPTEEQGLVALCTDPGLEGWNGPYLSHSEYLDDLWHHRFQYELRDGKPLLWSLGADGISGTEDDITVAYEEQTRSE